MQQLEELVAHQAAEIDTPSDQLKEQWEKIDVLPKAALRLRDRLPVLEQAGSGAHETPPPPPD